MRLLRKPRCTEFEHGGWRHRTVTIMPRLQMRYTEATAAKGSYHQSMPTAENADSGSFLQEAAVRANGGNDR